MTRGKKVIYRMCMYECVRMSQNAFKDKSDFKNYQKLTLLSTKQNSNESIERNFRTNKNM